MHFMNLWESNGKKKGPNKQLNFKTAESRKNEKEYKKKQRVRYFE